MLWKHSTWWDGWLIVWSYGRVHERSDTYEFRLPQNKPHTLTRHSFIDWDIAARSSAHVSIMDCIEHGTDTFEMGKWTQTSQQITVLIYSRSLQVVKSVWSKNFISNYRSVFFLFAFFGFLLLFFILPCWDLIHRNFFFSFRRNFPRVVSYQSKEGRKIVRKYFAPFLFNSWI